LTASIYMGSSIKMGSRGVTIEKRLGVTKKRNKNLNDASRLHSTLLRGHIINIIKRARATNSIMRITRVREHTFK
jgi:hypothetical protein